MMNTYFEKYTNKLNINAKGIRNCQRGAFYATLAHFTRSLQPCLIGLPTGSGKTALMAMLCFGLKARRVLIITPARILRDQTYEKFKTLDELKDVGSLTGKFNGPKVRNNQHEFQEEENWNVCKFFDVVVATTKTTSPKEKRIVHAPAGLFDVVFFDEAHHVPAPTWTALLESFQNSGVKVILLTGTPYRRDHIEINADLIYSYPIGRAIEDRIFAPVKFVDAGSPGKNRDLTLARAGLKSWKKTNDESSGKALLFIKTNRNKHANELCKIYKSLGVNVVAVHTDLLESENLKTLRDLKDKKIDGIIAVGMLGEGLDVPQLKVAIFHKNPQSLPHTLQVIGRIARTSTKITQGKVVGFSDDFSRDTFKLYDASPDWFKLIPDLEKKLLAGRVGEAGEETLGEGQDFLDDPDLSPFFSASIFEFKEKPFVADIGKIKIWKKSGINRIVSVKRISVLKNDTFVVITKKRQQPDWVRTGGYSRILHESLDLHIFFQHKTLVIEHTTCPEIANELRRELFEESLSLISRDKLNRVFKDGDGAYIVVGLQNSGSFSQANPAYKMLMGMEAQASVTNTDTKIFHTGHCLMRLKRNQRDSETRGIAYKHAKIWALRRDTLKNYREWCLLIATTLLEEGKVSLPGLERLRVSEPLKAFIEKPLAVVPSTSLLTRRVVFSYGVSNTKDVKDYSGVPEISVESYTVDQLLCNINDLGLKFSINRNENGEITYHQLDALVCNITVDPVEGEMRRYNLSTFLLEFPPRIIFSDGSTLSEGLYSKPIYVPELDPSIIKSIKWRPECDINSEVGNTQFGMSVQEFVFKKYITKNGKDIIIIGDHAAGELADFITIDLTSKNITFYHVKCVVKGKLPGGRKNDLEEVMAQAICSGCWIKNVGLNKEINRRFDKRAATKLLYGKKEQLAIFYRDYSPPLWSFKVVAVQPALAESKITKPIKTMIASAHDYIATSGGAFEVVCSY